MGRPRFIATEVTKVPWVNLSGDLCHEYDGRGNHRITLNGALGDWVCFASIATYKVGDRLFAASTDYWAGTLPEIFEVQTILPRSLSDAYREE